MLTDPTAVADSSLSAGVVVQADDRALSLFVFTAETLYQTGTPLVNP